MTEAERDYVSEMDQLIAEVTEASGWVAAIVAAKLRAQLLETDPELLDGWLHAMAVKLLVQAIRDHERAVRSAVRHRAGGRAFASAAQDFKDAVGGGDERVIETAGAALAGMFSAKHCIVIDGQNVWKNAADMTGPDHLFVAEHEYRREGNRLLMLDAFHRAVAKKVGKRRTADVLTEERYESMYQSIVRPSGKEAA